MTTLIILHENKTCSISCFMFIILGQVSELQAVYYGCMVEDSSTHEVSGSIGQREWESENEREGQEN